MIKVTRAYEFATLKGSKKSVSDLRAPDIQVKRMSHKSNRLAHNQHRLGTLLVPSLRGPLSVLTRDPSGVFHKKKSLSETRMNSD